MFWAGSFFIWIASVFLAGMVGARKDAGGLGLIAGVFLGPLGVLIMLASRGNLKDCVFCKEWIRFGAVVCPRCGRDLPIHEESASSVPEAPSGIKQLLSARTTLYCVMFIIIAAATYLIMNTWLP
jgi:hypothetical protein